MSNRRKIKKLERPVSDCRCPDCRAVNRATRRQRGYPTILVDPNTRRKTRA